jgi:hypothetical protein
MSDVPAKKSVRFWNGWPIFVRLFLGLIALLVLGSVVFVGIPGYRQINALEKMGGQWGRGGRTSADDRLPGWLAGQIPSRWRRGLVEIYSLTLDDGSAKEVDFEFLQAFPRLRTLHIYSKRMTDAQLRQLKPLTNLNSLTLGCPQLTDEGIEDLNCHTGLTHLFLSTSQVTGSGLSKLNDLKQLAYLGLHHTQMSDDGLAELARFPGLIAIDLDATKVTDAGLPHLAVLPNLKRVNLCRTRVTEAGIARLEEMVPGLRIQYSKKNSGCQWRESPAR